MIRSDLVNRSLSTCARSFGMLRRLLSLLVVISPGISSAQAADLIKIGILGIDNYGSVAYTEFLNKPHAEGVFEGVRVVAAYPIGSDDYPDSDKLLAQFVVNLNTLIAEQPSTPTPVTAEAAPTEGIRTIESAEVAPLNLLSAAGSPILKRAIPVVVVVVAVLVWLVVR